LVALNIAKDAYVSLDAGDDADATSKGLYFRPAADEDVEIINLSVTGTPRILWDNSDDDFNFNKGLDITGNIVVSGTVDGVDIATRDHAKYTDAEAVSAIEAAGLTFAENKGIILDAALSADEKWSGIVEIGTMGFGATVGDLIYLAVADTKWELAKADAAVTSKGKIGICLATVSEDATCNVLLYGKMRSAAFPAFTVGAPVHISAATAGDIVVAAPTGTTNFVVRIIGYGNTAEDLFFCPDNTYVELA
ncbi:hypothetical protein LCGC14_1608910, partial [marine sediment metagenome]